MTARYAVVTSVYVIPAMLTAADVYARHAHILLIFALLAALFFFPPYYAPRLHVTATRVDVALRHVILLRCYAAARGRTTTIFAAR